MNKGRQKLDCKTVRSGGKNSIAIINRGDNNGYGKSRIGGEVGGGEGGGVGGGG